MSHRTLTTSTGVVVSHSHSYGDWTPETKASIQTQAMTGYPGIQPVQYIHLDHSSEELLPTRRYNCWGFTFNPRQCWINSGNDVQNILNANGTQVFPPNIRIGDVICYRDSSNMITHTGRVWSVDASGQAILIQSKWGGGGEYLHPPLTVPTSYGTNVSYWRVTPLTGKGDAWIEDNAADDRLPYPPGTRWLSPDLWCNNSGGTTHQDPIRGFSNQLYVRLHNPDTLPISNATVRFYWADPNGGIPHTDWHDIGTASVSVPPGGTAIAGPVTWMPNSSVPEHSCLLAIADTGDSPFAATTLDPIVWPYDMARDNNIVQRNISVIALKGSFLKPIYLPFIALNPLPDKQPIEVRVDLTPVDLRDLGVLNLNLPTISPSLNEMDRRLQPQLRQIRPRPAIALDIEAGGDFWQFRGGRISARGMILATTPVSFGQGGRLNLMVTPTRTLSPGQTYRIDIQQRVGDQVTGGMTYIIFAVEKVTAWPWWIVIWQAFISWLKSLR